MQKITKEDSSKETKESNEVMSGVGTKATETGGKIRRSSRKVKIPKEIFTDIHFIPYSSKDIERVTKDVTMKQPMGSYNIYRNERFDEDKKEHPEINTISMGSVYAEEWADLSDIKKKKYEEKNAEDKKRYEQDYLIVKSILVQDCDREGISPFQLFANDKVRKEIMKRGRIDENEVMKQAKAEWDEMRYQQRNVWELKKKQNDDFWKSLNDHHKLTSYSLFCKKEYEAAEKEGKEMTNIMCDRKWKRLSEKEMKDLDDEIMAITKDRERAKELLAIERGEKPKQPGNPFNFFVAEKITKGCGDKIGREIGDEWNKLNNVLKKPYEEKFRQALLVYLYKMDLYKKGVKMLKPKQPKTAYIIFYESFKGKKMPEGVKGFENWISSMWNNLSEKEKEYYENLAEEDKKRVEKENEKNQVEYRIYDKPKKFLSAFNFFTMEKKKEGENMSDAVKRLCDEWDQMPAEKRSYYDNLALKDKEDYEEKMEMFKEKGYFIDKDIKEYENERRKEMAAVGKKKFLEGSQRNIPRKKVASKSRGKNKK